MLAILAASSGNFLAADSVQFYISFISSTWQDVSQTCSGPGTQWSVKAKTVPVLIKFLVFFGSLFFFPPGNNICDFINYRYKYYGLYNMSKIYIMIPLLHLKYSRITGIISPVPLLHVK